MKRLTISEILLLSNLDRKARRILFDPRRTILLGSNQTGKSSLVKSIYHALGAEPAKQDQRWLNAEVKSLIKFSVDTERYMLLRDGSYYSAFTGDGDFIDSFTHITDGLGPFLANIFDFRLVLPSRDQKPQVPPPAFLYLPFYIDQDASWQNAWSGFSRLFQFTGWRKSVAEYHAGVRDNRFYEVQAEALDAQRLLGQNTFKVEGLRSVIKNLFEDNKKVTFDLNPDAFGDQISRLLGESEGLRVEESALKEKLSDLNNKRALQRNRLNIATRALGEISKDFDFLSTLPTEQIECPTCGTEYENDFATRFAVATDEDRVAIYIEQIRQEIDRLDREIQKVYADFRVSQTQAEKIQAILAEKQGELSFSQIIESEGRKAADTLLAEQLATSETLRSQAQIRSDSAEEKLSAQEERLSSAEDAVLLEYASNLRRNLDGLSVLPLTGDIYTSLVPVIKETGSSLPRALLAYYFTFFELASKHSPSTVCPFVIDSPNQQAQDDKSLEIMLKFIPSFQPAETQVILAVEKTMGVELGGTVIELTDKYHLLQPSEYEPARAEFTALTKKSTAIR